MCGNFRFFRTFVLAYKRILRASTSLIDDYVHVLSVTSRETWREKWWRLWSDEFRRDTRDIVAEIVCAANDSEQPSTGLSSRSIYLKWIDRSCNDATRTQREQQLRFGHGIPRGDAPQGNAIVNLLLFNGRPWHCDTSMSLILPNFRHISLNEYWFESFMFNSGKRSLLRTLNCEFGKWDYYSDNEWPIRNSRTSCRDPRDGSLLCLFACP